jgi:rare lipoprotein A (peptidoglycan hydrolase)
MEAEDLREKKHTWQGMAIGFIIVFSALLIGAIFTGKSSTANEKRLGDVIAGVRSDVTGLKLATEAAARKVEVPVGGIMEGVASWYGPGFHGRPTASGRIYDMEADTVALPDAKMLGQRVLIYNEDNGRAAIGLCTDLGPFVGSRVVDVSLGVARKLGMEKAGLAWVTVVRLGPENNFR